ncbi:MAG: VCBS repeat-containing protein [Candidatus Sabulitectum sp.]|nr:VCBS repeat-containing protein [Candidatus Sabulitectum sp.]
MSRQSPAHCLKILTFITLVCLFFPLQAHGDTSSLTATQTNWAGGLPHSRPYVALWSDMFESSYAVDWSDTPGSLTIVSGFERKIIWYGGSLSITHFTPFDVDSDGDLDMFFLQNTAQVGWLENFDCEQGWVLHEIEHPIYQPKALVANDFDGNGFPDLAVSSRQDGLLMLYQVSEDRWEIEHIDRLFYSGWDLDTADINKDGVDDLVGISWVPNYICWWENPVSMLENWNPHIIADLEIARNSILIDDFDGDGLTEVCAFSPSNTWAGVNFFVQGDSYREPWKELRFGDWTDDVNHVAVLQRYDDDNQHTFSGLAIGKQGHNSSEYGFFILNSEYVRQHTLSLGRESPQTAFIRTGDIDGDADMDICINARCFENVEDKSTWIPHNYLDNVSTNMQISNPVCVDLDGNGTDELVYIESGSIWFVDHSMLVSRGELTSHYFEPQEVQEWKRLSWESEEPSGTSVSMFFRYNRQSDWIGPFRESIDLTEYESEGINQFQYRVVLESDYPTVSPVLHSITVEWE